MYNLWAFRDFLSVFEEFLSKYFIFSSPCVHHLNFSFIKNNAFYDAGFNS